MDAELVRAAEAASGFMPAAEGRALFDAAAAHAARGPVLEIGSYSGKSTIYLAAAARAASQKVVTVDHHRGSDLASCRYHPRNCRLIHDCRRRPPARHASPSRSEAREPQWATVATHATGQADRSGINPLGRGCAQEAFHRRQEGRGVLEQEGVADSRIED